MSHSQGNFAKCSVPWTLHQNEQIRQVYCGPAQCLLFITDVYLSVYIRARLDSSLVIHDTNEFYTLTGFKVKTVDTWL